MRQMTFMEMLQRRMMGGQGQQQGADPFAIAKTMRVGDGQQRAAAMAQMQAPMGPPAGVLPPMGSGQPVGPGAAGGGKAQMMKQAQGNPQGIAALIQQRMQGPR